MFTPLQCKLDPLYDIYAVVKGFNVVLVLIMWQLSNYPYLRHMSKIQSLRNQTFFGCLILTALFQWVMPFTSLIFLCNLVLNATITRNLFKTFYRFCNFFLFLCFHASMMADSLPMLCFYQLSILLSFIWQYLQKLIRIFDPELGLRCI